MNFIFPLEDWERIPNPLCYQVSESLPDEYDSDESIKLFEERIPSESYLMMPFDEVMQCWWVYLCEKK